MVKDYYKKNQSIECLVETIETKFNDFGVSQHEELMTVLGLDSEETNTVKTALLVVYGKKLGIESFDKVCEQLGVKNGNQLSSFEKLKLISKVANQGWYPNFNNTNERKHFPYFESIEGVFSFYGVHCYASTVTVPSALLYQNYDLAYFMGVYYFELYEDYLK
jgi:hypothetical protein